METRKLKRDGLYVGNAGYLYDFAVTRNLASLLPPAKKVMRKFAAWAIDNPLYYLPVDDLLLDPELSTADRAHLAAMKNANNYPVRWPGSWTWRRRPCRRWQRSCRRACSRCCARACRQC